ncbi:MAG: hypothetical protein AAF939_19600 [Planctomycetota bacterium]
MAKLSFIKEKLRKHLVKGPTDPNTVFRRQQEIYQYVLSNSESIGRPNFQSISSADLGLLFQVTDEHFFDGMVSSLCEQVANRPLAFRLSTRMTNSGGMTTMFGSASRPHSKLDFEIAIATTPLFSSFQGNESLAVGGRNCSDRLEALQRIMEHEMIHLIEMLVWRTSNCAAKRFKSLVGNFFHHSESHHQLLTPRDIAKTRLGIVPGDKVRFQMDGKLIQGHVNAITKRATVLVKSPKGRLYDDGYRYEKFYVPLNRLKRA